MSDLSEALELMHTSISRWRTFRASGWEWRHRLRSRQAWKRSIPQEGVGRALIYGALVGQPEAEPEEVEERWRLWLEPPDRTRAEFTVEDESVNVVFRGDTWWSRSPTRGTLTNRGDPHQSHGLGPGASLVEPAPILSAAELEVSGRGTFLGRSVIEVVATPTPLDEDDEESPYWRVATHGLGSGADHYLLLVDAGRGVLLRSEARLRGMPFRVLEMESVAFDEDLPEDTFRPPEKSDGEQIEHIESSRWVGLDELPSAVPFTVLVPERPPFGPPEARIDPPDRRRGIPEQVHIEFASPILEEVKRRFFLVESAEPIPERPWVEWRDEGGVRYGEDSRVQPAVRLVRLVRSGTHVEIQGYGVGRNELLELARSLVPLPASPPTLPP